MRKPCVFVSSTCYDLQQLRADLHQYLENAGLESVLSEYATFPVDPDSTTVRNCQNVVENKADIFVLVIGGRYGSAADKQKSVTNLEYLTARAKSVPVYVFVMRSLLSILPVWKENPEGNFAGVADSPRLFEFISSIYEGGEQWVFPFDSAQDIAAVLRGGSTVHVLRMPSAKDVFEYRRAFPRVLDLPFNKQELTINLRAAGDLYKRVRRDRGVCRRSAHHPQGCRGQGRYRCA